jgi:hypothetical protein
MTNVVKGSAMRFSLTLTSIGIFIIFLSIAFYVVMRAIEGVEPEWTSMSVFAIGLAGVLTGAGWNKTKQKEIESRTNEEK